MHFPILIEVRRPIFLPIFCITMAVLALAALCFTHLSSWAKGLGLFLWCCFFFSAFWGFKRFKGARLLAGTNVSLLKPVCRALYLASPDRMELVMTENTPEKRVEVVCQAYAKLPFCLFLRFKMTEEPSSFSLLLGGDQLEKEDWRKLTVWCRTQSVKDSAF